MAKGSIYLITNKITGKGYVGQTVCPPQIRMDRHVEAAFVGHRNTRLSSAMRRHGTEAFEWSVLKSAVPRQRLRAEENRFIDQLGTRHPGGYNMTGGSRGGATARTKRGYRRETSVTLKETVTYYEEGKPVLKRTRLYKETRRTRVKRLPEGARSPRRLK